jgi:hypothetical protein
VRLSERKALSALAETLREELRAIRQELQEHTAANHDAHEAANDRWREVPGIIATNVLGRDDDKTTAETHSQQHERQQDKIIFWARLAFFAAAAYGAVAFWQGILMHRTIKQSQRAMEMDQRPWLEFRFSDIGSVTIQFSANNPISIPGQFLNIGKTPALDIKGVTVLQVVDTGKDPEMPDRKTGIALRATGEAVPQGAKWTKQMEGQVFEEAPIFPGKHSQFQIFRVKPSTRYGLVEPLMLNPDEYAKLTSKAAYIAVWGEVKYSDIFGVSHWARFCSTQGVGFDATSEKCVNYGDVDKNPQ